jgi:hypothetical protein
VPSSSSEHFRVRPGEPVPDTQDGLGRSIIVLVVRGLVVLVVDTLMLVVVIFLCPFSEGVFSSLFGIVGFPVLCLSLLMFFWCLRSVVCPVLYIPEEALETSFVLLDVSFIHNPSFALIRTFYKILLG